MRVVAAMLACMLSITASDDTDDVLGIDGVHSVTTVRDPSRERIILFEP